MLKGYTFLEYKFLAEEASNIILKNMSIGDCTSKEGLSKKVINLLLCGVNLSIAREELRNVYLDNIDETLLCEVIKEIENEYTYNIKGGTHYVIINKLSEERKKEIRDQLNIQYVMFDITNKDYQKLNMERSKINNKIQQLELKKYQQNLSGEDKTHVDMKIEEIKKRIKKNKEIDNIINKLNINYFCS